MWQALHCWLALNCCQFVWCGSFRCTVWCVIAMWLNCVVACAIMAYILEHSLAYSIGNAELFERTNANNSSGGAHTTLWRATQVRSRCSNAVPFHNSIHVGSTIAAIYIMPLRLEFAWSPDVAKCDWLVYFCWLHLCCSTVPCFTVVPASGLAGRRWSRIWMVRFMRILMLFVLCLGLDAWSP